jgi:hypothetical protein
MSISFVDDVPGADQNPQRKGIGGSKITLSLQGICSEYV